MLRFNGGPPGHEHGWADTELSRRTTTPDIAGWRPCCACGWRGSRLHRRREPGTEQPSDAARLAVAAEWESHIAGISALAHLVEVLSDHQATVDRLARERNEADRQLVEATRQARAVLTWQEIADVLGVSRQAAHDRLGQLMRRRRSDTTPLDQQLT